MKKIFTLSMIGVFTLLSITTKAQFTENFETDSTALKGNCWQFVNIEWTSNPAYVITGVGSMLSNPPVTSFSTRDIITPPLTVTSTSLTISFNYKLTNSLNGAATRTIEIGIQDPSNNYTTLDIVNLDRNSPTTVQSYSNSFPATPGMYKLVIKTGGSTGAGNVRTVIDDFYTDATSIYAPGTYCNSAPVAVNDNFSGFLGAPVYGNVMLNDSEPDNETMTSAIVATSPDGTVVLNPDGSFTFTPYASFTGPSTTFTYRLTDNGFSPLSSNVATVTINVVLAASLPVHLISFQGNMNKNNKVTLQWKVADNETADRFEVQRSYNGNEFTSIGIVLTTEKVGAENYMFYETVNTSDKVMYRLRMIDKKQDIDFSKILVFQNKTTGSGNLIKVYNNPVNDKLTFSFTSSSTQTVDVKVYDMTGRLQMNQKVNSYEGSNMISLPLASTFKPGLYVVVVNDGTQSQTAKFVKQ